MTYPNDANVYLPGTIQIPSSLVITAITKTFPAVITVEVNPITDSNTYRAGQLVKLNVPYSYGMFQANGLTGQILNVVGNDLIVDIDARNFDTFTVPSIPPTPASVAPAGSRNLEFSNNTGQIAFQSLNDRGN